MFFSKAIVASVLALASVVSSQVIVTVTNTVTIVTVTVTPQSTSTFTTFVTVGGNPPPTPITTLYYTQTTLTATQTITSQQTTATACPIAIYGQCGGQNWTGCTQCAAGAACKSSNAFYWQCVAPTVVTVTQTVYKGDAL